MNRRGFLGSLLTAGIAAATFDPERLLWTPGQKTFFLPAVRPRFAVGDFVQSLPGEYPHDMAYWIGGNGKTHVSGGAWRVLTPDTPGGLVGVVTSLGEDGKPRLVQIGGIVTEWKMILNLGA